MDGKLLQRNQEFNPSNPGDWAPVPSNVGEALDQLGTKAFNGGAPLAKGLVNLVGGTATVNNPNANAANLIFLTRQTGPGIVAISVTNIVDGVSFTITSANGADTARVAWQILSP